MTEERHANKGLPTVHIKDPNQEPHQRERMLRLARYALIGLAVILVLGLLRTLIMHWINSGDLEKRSNENNVMHVLAIQATDTSPDMRLTLPGTIESVYETQIHARTNGYVKEWFKNIGDRVKKGDVLATLDIPEVNRQVDEAIASFNLAKIAYERWKKLREEDAVSQQELDEKTSVYQQTQAALQRSKESLKFGQIVAPFDGIVTRRNVNVGDLVNAGNGGTGQAMFGISKTNQFHVYVYVPQDRSSVVKVGKEVGIYEPASRDKAIKGRISRTAGAIDANTRTFQVDIEIPDTQSTLLPGAYVEVAIPLDGQDRMLLPTKTLLFGSAGPQVAVVKDGKVQRQKVLLGVDYGQTIEIIGGIDPHDQIIINPRDSILDGQQVVIETPKEKPKEPIKPTDKGGA